MLRPGASQLLAMLVALTVLGAANAAKKTEEDDAQVLRLWRLGFDASKSLKTQMDTWVTDRPCARKAWGIGCSLIDGEQRVTSIELILKGTGSEKVYLATDIPGILSDLPLTTLRIVGEAAYPSCRIYSDTPGTLPGTLWKESASLTTLVISRCQMKGRLPTHTALPPNLQTLDLSYNQLTGELLPGWANLKQLKAVNLVGNSISGKLLEAQWMPPSIQEYNLGQNKLTGDIPDWSSLPKLESLYVSNNSLSGSLPAKLPPSLEVLHLQYNRIGGSIPKWPAHKSMRTLFLAGNKLTGTIPDLSPLSGLEDLFLDGNSLSGQIQAVFPPALITLWLNNNKLTGTIPSLAYLGDLVDLNLGYNQLTQIPPAAFLPPNIQTLNMQDNLFKGFMPDYSKRTNIGAILLAHNQLKGSLPSKDTLPPKLQALALAGNQFTGQLPKDWAGMKHLYVVDVQYNSGISGQIPGEWGQQGAFPGIAALELKPGTALCGNVPSNLQGKVTDGKKPLASLGSCPKTTNTGTPAHT